VKEVGYFSCKIMKLKGNIMYVFSALITSWPPKIVDLLYEIHEVYDVGF
jgi:hypothetical protein